VRIAAADALAELKETRAKRYLAMFINDADRDVRSTINATLGKLKDGSPIDNLNGSDRSNFVKTGI
jgi:HEAT repeat protein